MDSHLKTVSTFVQAAQPLLVHVICVLGLAIRPRSLAISITLPLMTWVLSKSLLRDPRAYGEEYSLNSYLMMFPWIWLDWVVMGNSDREQWRRIDAKSTEKSGTKGVRGDVPRNFMARLKWAGRLTANPRLLGYSSQIAKMPKGYAPDLPRSWAILRKVLRMLYFVGVIVAIKFVFAQTSYTTYYDNHGHPRSDVLTRPGWLEGMLFAWLFILSGYAGIEACFALTAVVALALGSPVHTVPPAGGDATQMYTVRKCWGEVWHGLLRRLCTAPGNYLAHDVFHLARGTFGSRYLKLFVAFFVSACVHSFGAMLTMRTFQDNGDFAWFFAQAIAIFVEDHVILFGKKIFGTQHATFWRTVGYAWVIVWYGLSIQHYLFSMYSRGMSMVS
ncbi:hypothetical protein EJ05DRAFT_539667 [Pseudovirgaria hyperparasitica]|uniref:Wax synthase domain-containing protein n=1 Tax=Pseudovirgaria hyperparasitica TaxID=470096 RepID=A0A6A6W431_9PEZI|nr:uncharacterized protein EJ05DRAFT_539667 [Pseudovirgaria hyperparasitica]KAF2756784.1 hypothetical protein EJ05DRAFT_539667 [Pseudovirgaria hyperparasitica]